MTTTIRWIGLVVFVVICLGAGGLGAIATTPEIDGWYTTIAKNRLEPARQRVRPGVENAVPPVGSRRQPLAGL